MRETRKLSNLELGLMFIGGMLGLGSELKANGLALTAEPELTVPLTNPSRVNVAHYSNGEEDYDSRDARYFPGDAPKIEVYIRKELGFFPEGDPETRLSTETRGVDSMSDVTIEVTGRGLAHPTRVDLRETIVPVKTEENMLGKKITLQVYERVDNGSGGFDYVPAGRFNGWGMNYSQQPITLTVRNTEFGTGGEVYPSHKLTMSFSYNKETDLNNDGRVDYEDLAKLSEDWLKSSGNHLSDISGPEGKADGVVDLSDLSRFVQDWMS